MGLFQGTTVFLGDDIGRGEMTHVRLWGLKLNFLETDLKAARDAGNSDSETVSLKLSLPCLTCAPSRSQRKALDSWILWMGCLFLIKVHFLKSVPGPGWGL